MTPWAILFEQKEIIWSFAVDEENFPERARNLIMGIQDFGQTLYGEGVTMVEFEPVAQKISSLNNLGVPPPDQLFVVNLSDYFLLLISDLPSLTAIMPYIDLHQDMNDLLRSVLVAQGTNIYANLMLKAKNNKEEAEIDHLFRKIIFMTGRKDANKLIINGSCSLSPLVITELLLFHTFLREHFHTLSVARNLEQWAIMSHKNGTELKYYYNISVDRAILLSGLLSAFINYTQYVFDIVPTRMIFGSTELQDIRIFASNEYFLAVNNPEQLLIDNKFQKTFDRLYPEDKNEIIPRLIPFLQLETGKLIQKRLTTDFPTLLQLYKSLRQDKEILTNIRGIGSINQSKLQKSGVLNISQLVKLDLKELKVISSQTGNSKDLKFSKLLKWQEAGRRILKSSQKLTI